MNKILKTIWKFIWYWIDILGGPIISVLFLLTTSYITTDLVWTRYLASLCIIISIPASIIRIIREKNLIRTDFSIIELELVDKNGEHISPYKLRNGENEFHCRATYADGYIDEYFPAYWTCWRKDSTTEPFSVFGESKKERVLIHCNANHEHYRELACWLFKPEKTKAISGNRHSSVTFDYSRNDCAEYFCKSCNKKLSKLDEKCPECGNTSRNISLKIQDSISIYDQLRSKLRREKDGRNKVIHEQKVGMDYHKATHKWNFLARIIDRENNRYYELIKDGKTDETIKETKESLSEHQNHGYAQKQK